MANKITVPFSGTPEQEANLRSKLAELKKSSKDVGLLISALQIAQEIYGYLPETVMQIVADEFGASLAEVYGIATFYAQFSLYPNGKYRVSVCLGTACYVKGSGDISDKVKQILKIKEGECTADMKFSYNSTRCIGCCGLAPVMTVNDDVYGRLTVDQVAGILAKYN